MYRQLVVKPDTNIGRLWSVPGADALATLRADRCTVVVSTASTETNTCLEFGQSLAMFPGVSILLVCQVMLGCVVRLRFSRFIQLARRIASGLAIPTSSAFGFWFGPLLADVV